VSSALARNPPAVLGLGYVQALAREMSAQLQATLRSAKARAAASNKPVVAPLTSKGVSFGSITALPDGGVQTSELEGIDADLVVKPFGWKGHTAELRQFGDRAARIHFGIQSHPSLLEHQEDPDAERYGSGPHWYDADGDGVQRELEEGTLTALAIYMALLEVPVIIPPHDSGLRERWARGGELFDRIGCIDCHKRSMPLASSIFREHADSTAGPGTEVDLSQDGEPPRASLDGVMLFSDLKRHDMGAALADPHEGPDGIDRQLFLTRPLWGLAESAPYLHDGRASSIPQAILTHDGEAAAQRANFEALDDAQKADLHVYLLSLTREPKLRVAR